MIPAWTMLAGLALAVEGTGAAATPPEALVLGLRAADRTLETVFVEATGVTPLGRGLAVPRKSRWWRVDVLKMVARSRGDVGGYRESFALVAAPAGRKLRLPPVRAQSGGGSEEPVCSGGNQITVHFAGPEWISFEDSRMFECEGDMRPSIDLGSVTWPLDLLSLPPERRDPGDAFATAIGPEIQKAVDARIAATPASPESGCSPGSGRAAAIIRNRGRWAFQAEGTSDATVCRGDVTRLLIDEPVPSHFVGPDALPQPFERYAAERPTLTDALASPSGAVVVLVTAAGVEVRSPGRAPVQYAMPDRTIVMAQWAVGARNVERWRKDAAAAVR